MQFEQREDQSENRLNCLPDELRRHGGKGPTSSKKLVLLGGGDDDEEEPTECYGPSISSLQNI